jgi:hypothetical protein
LNSNWNLEFSIKEESQTPSKRDKNPEYPKDPEKKPSISSSGGSSSSSSIKHQKTEAWKKTLAMDRKIAQKQQKHKKGDSLWEEICKACTIL